MRIIGLALVAVFAMGAIGASTASAHRTWWFCEKLTTKTGNFRNNLCSEKVESTGEFETRQVGAKGAGKKITAKLKAGQEAILKSEIKKEEVNVICKKLTISNGEIYNEEPETGKKTGRDKGKIVFEECRLTGLASILCKLSTASAKEIITPPVEEGRSLLVERGNKEGPIWNDFLPQPEGASTNNTKESLFAVIETVNNGIFTCPTKSDKVKSTLHVGEFLEAAGKEGEGGVAAEITPQGYSTTKDFEFPCTSVKKAWNWKGNEIKIGEFAEFVPGQEGPASFCGWNPTTKKTETLEVEAELTSKEAFDVGAEGPPVDWKVNGKFLKAGEEKDAMGTGTDRFDWKNDKGETVISVCKYTYTEKVKGNGTDERIYLTYECEYTAPASYAGKKYFPKQKNEPTELKGRAGKFYDVATGVGFKVQVFNSKGEAIGEEEISGDSEGEWDNATSELLYPETALEGSTLKTSGGETVVAYGSDKLELEGGGTLEVGEE